MLAEFSGTQFGRVFGFEEAVLELGPVHEVVQVVDDLLVQRGDGVLVLPEGLREVLVAPVVLRAIGQCLEV